MIGPEPPLAQKRYMRSEPWRVVASSLMLVQMNSVRARPTILAFFERWPTPEAFIRSSRREVREHLKPIGFQNRREQYIRAVTEAWLASDGPEKTAEWVNSLPGCGKYVTDAYRLVVLDENVEPNDWALHRWWLWRWGSDDAS